MRRLVLGLIIVLTVPFVPHAATAQSRDELAAAPPDVGAILITQVGEYITAREQDEVLAMLADNAAFLASLVPPSSPSLPIRNTGAHSDAWWRGVSVCEQGGRNDPYFGYFSIMDGSAGGLPWGTQVAMANGIISHYGDSAWAASCVNAGYAASPSG